MLLAHNLARHRGTEQLIRFGKADVAAVLASQRLQGSRVTTHAENVLNVSLEDFGKEFEKTDIVIDTSADAQVRRRLSLGWASAAKVLLGKCLARVVLAKANHADSENQSGRRK